MQKQDFLDDQQFQRHICLYLHMHQPYRVRPYTIFDVDQHHDYFNAPSGDKTNNRDIFLKVAEKSYRPTLKMLLKLAKTEPKFKVSLSIPGMTLEQAEEYAPDILDKLRDLVATGKCELVAETYYHSLAFFYDLPEFEAQVKQQMDTFKRLFGVTPTSFRGTELSYNNHLGKWAASAGFKAILAEGWDKVLGWRSPNFVYEPWHTDGNAALLLKNYRLSDDIAFRFSDHNWKEHPLSVEKYLHWCETATLQGPLLNLFMDFETFGEHQWADSGIFEFFDKFVQRWCSDPSNDFLRIDEAAEILPKVAEISMPETVTWADTERDLSAWTGNKMQQEALKEIYSLSPDITQLPKSQTQAQILDDWRKLQTSDHPYYMCTKYWSDGDVHAYFSPYESPYFAYLYWANAVRDLKDRLAQAKISKNSR
ncbi:MAG: glycoside hydrolase family 57 protein [Candidatus Nomurabacteria bacterium]|jgi:alpha-amylase|nr:glycoside hydrolase family 57 protein [Candidatus Nomurabacteria bacterium]